MNRKTIRVFPKIITTIFVLLMAAPFAVFAEEEEFTPRAARISYIEGPVTVQRTIDEDWSDASLNLPMMVGDKIYTGVGGRAELQLDDQVVIRLDGDTYIHFANLEDTLTRIGLLKGAAAVHADEVEYTRAPVEVQSEGFIAAVKPWGKIRFNVDQNGSAEILARRGEAIVTAGGQPYQLVRGDQLYVRGESVGFEKLNQEDDFDQWCDFRDAMDAASKSSQYISTRVAGYSDLDRYGAWVEIPEYGRVWRPSVVAVDWAPYRDGRWVWYDSCGWTWVSYEPWGWAPYHYGRWVYVDRYRWCWAPHYDVVHVVHHYRRPIWYPALVSFSYARHGRHFSFGIGGGYYDGPCVGWFALGPRDPFVPWHHGYRRYYGHRGDRNYIVDRSKTYIDNSVHIDNSTHIYQNERAPNAVTVVPERDFTQGTYENRAVADIGAARGQELAVGEKAIQEMEGRRILETKPARVDGRAGGAVAAAKSDASLKSPAAPRANEGQRGSSVERSVKAARNAAAEPVNAAADRPVASEARRGASNNADAKASPMRNPAANAGAASGRTSVQSRDASPARSAGANSAMRNPAAAERETLIQETPRTNPARTTTESARTRSSSVRQESSSSLRTTTRDSREALSNSRTTSPIRNPMRSDAASTMTNSSLRTGKQNYTSPSRSTTSLRSSSTATQNSRSSREASSTRSYSPARSSSGTYEGNQSSMYSPPSRYSTPSNTRSYSTSPSRSYSSSPAQSYSPSRSSRSSSSYSAPRSYSSSRSYSAARSSSPSSSYSAPRSYSSTRSSSSYSAPRSSSPSRSYSAPRSSSPSRSYSAPRSRGGTSAPRTSPRR
ncbi:MAG: FecR domain-containing protein [Candidatus Omnitrophica bacterium]|nr:FecR domain-containing protein [Candidatus Omnitrophota bacterium]